MPTDAPRRSGALLLVAAVFLAISSAAFFLDGDPLPASGFGLVALVLGLFGTLRLTAR